MAKSGRMVVLAVKVQPETVDKRDELTSEINRVLAEAGFRFRAGEYRVIIEKAVRDND